MLDGLKVGLANSQTTVAGSGLAAAYYLASNGLAIPQNHQQWMTFLVSALLAILGLLAKDATTGSQP